MKQACLTILTLVFSLSIYAESSLMETQNTEINLSEDQVAAIASKITIECEYDTMCLYNKIEEGAKANDPIYIALFKMLQEHKAQIEFEHKNCNTDDIRSFKKASTKCDKELIGLIGTDESKLNDPQIQETYTSCHAIGFGKLAADGNIFAQEMMKRFTNNEEREKWQKMVDEHKGKPEYDVYEKCGEFVFLDR